MSRNHGTRKKPRDGGRYKWTPYPDARRLEQVYCNTQYPDYGCRVSLAQEVGSDESRIRVREYVLIAKVLGKKRVLQGVRQREWINDRVQRIL